MVHRSVQILARKQDCVLLVVNLVKLLVENALNGITKTNYKVTSFCSSCSKMACRKTRRSWLEDFWSNMPAWITFWSTLSLYLAAARIFSSTLLTVQSRSTRTSFCWPMRWARSWACRSWIHKHEIPPLILEKMTMFWTFWDTLSAWNQPGGGSNHCQRWQRCQPPASSGPVRRLWCWEEKWSIGILLR